jgi:hypothetical protein
MLDQRRVATPLPQSTQPFPERRHEDLLACSNRVTNEYREPAGDLVQDVFVQSVLEGTGLEEIENIDGYSRRMLRYMHVSPLRRSAQHLNEAAPSSADYNSRRFGWRTIESPRRMQDIEEFRQICTYACAHKESSRVGRVLIQRSFHEYFPTEIAGNSDQLPQSWKPMSHTCSMGSRSWDSRILNLCVFSSCVYEFGGCSSCNGPSESTSTFCRGRSRGR